MTAATIWVDVEDIYMFAARGGRRPTGIQRLAFELCRAMHARAGARVRFVRHDRAGRGVVEIAWSDLQTVFDGLTESPGGTRGRPVPAGPGKLRLALRRVARWLLARLPTELRDPVERMLRAAQLGLLALADVLRGIARLMAKRLRRWRSDPTIGAATDLSFLRDVRPGDVLFVPGAAFLHDDYARLLMTLRRQHRLRVALLVYDLIPLRRPEFCDALHTRLFGAWLNSTVPLCDHIFAISRSAAEELEAHARAAGIALPCAVRPIPIGTGFGDGAPMPAERPAGLPAPGSYVLFVSTIEARKNHALVVRVWQRLLAQMPAEAVPTLVFAGRVGWMVGDLMQQLANTGFLGGKVVLVDRPDDQALAALYRGCLFTVFPSLYEGWGLPVTESLAFGKPCVISDATSLPEAGGRLARYFDPEDIAGATRLIRATIEDRAGLAAWQAQVAREYRPVSWDESARAVLDHIDTPTGDAPEGQGAFPWTPARAEP